MFEFFVSKFEITFLHHPVSLTLKQDTKHKHRRAPVMSNGALAPMALAMKKRANDDMMDMYPDFTVSSLPPEH